jgi:alpha-L-rhamnosidase
MMKKISIFVCSFVCACALFAENFKPQKLTVGEFFENPIGYSLDDLSMSWQLPLIRNGISQTAYRVIASRSPTDFSELVWDSGKVMSDQSVKVRYGGAPISSRERIYWKVRVWDENGVESDWSDVNFFEAGLLSHDDWQAKWILTPEKPHDLYFYNSPHKWGKILPDGKRPRMGVSPIHIRKNFKSDKPVSARLYVSTLGTFHAFINGKRIDNDYWKTGWTDYNKRVQANTYDVTKYLTNGKNVLAFTLADGWYSSRIQSYKVCRAPKIIAQLELTYADGSKKVFATDETCKVSKCAITYSDIYDGEIYDATKEIYGWNKIDFDDSSWKNALAENVGKAPIIEPRRNQPVVVKDKLYPLSVKKISRSAYIFDFGQNMVGVPVVKIPRLKKGTEIKLRFAEMLNKDGTMYTENYRSAVSTDFYTSNGKPAIYEPNFTFHGYRYLEVSGLPYGVELTADDVYSKVLYNDMELTGKFVCSHPKVNQLQSNIQWGQRGNYLEVPTDCPQRDERVGWTGDAQVFIPTGAFNMNVNAFFAKWCQSLLDNQTPEGAFPHVSPSNWAGVSPAWCDAGVICPWEIYLAYNDVKILKNCYSGMYKWVEFVKKTSKNLIRPEVGFGDWLQPSTTFGKDSSKWCGNTPKSLIGTAYFFKCATIMQKVATILGKTDDAKYFKNLAEDVRKAYIKEFVKADGVVATNSQTGYLLTLAFDILPEADRQKTFDKFVKKFADDNYYLDTGFVGTPLLAPVLTKFGRMDLACRLVLNEDYPSWIYSINQGATTMWERWNSYSHKDGFGEAKMNSFNHYAYGAIGEWLYRDLGGLWHTEDAVGYKKIAFTPKSQNKFTFATVYKETPYGTAQSSWKIEGNKMLWDLIIPANSSGQITLPTNSPTNATINGKPATALKFELPSGIHKIEIKK